MWHVRGKGQVYARVGGNLRERNHLENPGIDGRTIIKWIFRKWDMGAWAGLICPRIGPGGGHL